MSEPPLKASDCLLPLPTEALSYMAKHPNLYLACQADAADQHAESGKKEKPHGKFATFALSYPATGWVERFGLAFSPRHDEYQPILDLVATLEALYDADGLAKPIALRQLAEQHSVGELAGLCASTQSILALKKRLGDIQSRLHQRAGTISDRQTPLDTLLCHILDQSYCRMMDEDPRRLNRVPDAHRTKNYLYGELRPSLVSEMVRQHLKIVLKDQTSLFMDLGSGIGNVVLQVSAMTGCRAIGVEILPLPLSLSHRFKTEFTARLDSAYGYTQLAKALNSNIRLVEGDFLAHALVQAHIEQADALLVNNATFASDVNQRLMDLFLSLKEGAKIISLMNFAPVKRKFSHYHAFRPASIFRVEKYSYGSDCVSWTSAPGHYYVHTVDRASLRAFVSEHASRRIPAQPASAVCGKLSQTAQACSEKQEHEQGIDKELSSSSKRSFQGHAEKHLA